MNAILLRRNFLARCAACVALAAAVIPAVLNAQQPVPQAVAGRPDPQQIEFFEKQVRPILVTRCYDCHSHAGGDIRGGLALDSRNGWELGGDSGPAVVPGNSGNSLLIRAVRRQGEIKMPPDEELPAAEIDILAKWIQDGAADPRQLDPQFDPANWWSFQPLVRPAVPDAPAGSNGNGTPSQTIDAFIRAKLREKQLSPAPAADRRTLIRRLTFDLHGLPPTADEVAEFVADADPRAYERLVDRLLDSPRYGERWGRHWLDVVRYGDSRGNEHDGFREHAWRYRDYVIDALNRDLPYDRFIQEQLAADALAPDNAALTAALGFLVAGPDVLSGGEQLERDEYITVTMSAFTSTTVHCARCHHHKFDPIRHEDYYALQAALAGVRRRDAPVDLDPAVRAERTRWTNLKSVATRKPLPPELLTDENRRFVADWQQAVQQQAASWKTLRPQQATAASGTAIAVGDNGMLRVDGDGNTAVDKDDYTLVMAGPLEKFRLLRLEALTDEKLSGGGPGFAADGDFSLSEFEVWLHLPGKDQPQRIGLKTVRVNAELKDHPADRVRDNRPESGWRGGPATAGVPHTLVAESGGEVVVPEGGQLRLVLKHQQGSRLSLARFRLSASDQPLSPHTLPPVPAAAVANLAAGQRSDEQWGTLMAHALPLRCDEELARLPVPTMFYVGAGNLPHEPKANPPRTVQMLKRGERPVGGVGPGALKFVSYIEPRMDDATAAGEPARRLWLARWLSHPENPLTWRSIVNRVWHYHFGRGIVDTPGDLGHQGGLPSHVELLDWLACEFRDRGRSLKDLHRWIVTSQTYRQAVVPNAAAERIDRDNRLLWRMNRRRLDAESFRDAVLAVTGGLDLTVGGPGVIQFEVKNGFNTTKLANYDRFDWNAPGARRRSVYRFVFRTRPDPFMTAMDFPDASQFVPARATSLTPLQSLALLNNHFVLQNCELLAVKTPANDPGAAVEAVFARLLQRAPSPEERAEFAAYAGEFGVAAMCRLLLNSNEFLFIE